MANNFNDNANKKNLNGSNISYTTYRTNYSNDEMMKENGGVPSSGGGSNLEDNKEATIDVSTYTEPVEVEPTQGKDGMKKATITLDNIPSGGEFTYNLNTFHNWSSYVPSVGKKIVWGDQYEEGRTSEFIADGVSTITELGINYLIYAGEIGDYIIAYVYTG